MSETPDATPTDINRLATWGFWVAISSIFLFFLWVPGPIAVVLSGMGLNRATKIGAATGKSVGRGLAIAGLAIGIVYTLLPFIQSARGLM